MEKIELIKLTDKLRNQTPNTLIDYLKKYAEDHKVSFENLSIDLISLIDEIIKVISKLDYSGGFSLDDNGKRCYDEYRRYIENFTDIVETTVGNKIPVDSQIVFQIYDLEFLNNLNEKINKEIDRNKEKTYFKSEKVKFLQMYKDLNIELDDYLVPILNDAKFKDFKTDISADQINYLNDIHYSIMSVTCKNTVISNDYIVLDIPFIISDFKEKYSSKTNLEKYLRLNVIYLAMKQYKNDLFENIDSVLEPYYNCTDKEITELIEDNKRAQLKLNMLFGKNEYNFTNGFYDLLQNDKKKKRVIKPKKELGFVNLFRAPENKKLNDLYQLLQQKGMIDSQNKWNIQNNSNEPAQVYFHLKNNGVIITKTDAVGLKCFYAHFGLKIEEKNPDKDPKICTIRNAREVRNTANLTFLDKWSK